MKAVLKFGNCICSCCRSFFRPVLDAIHGTYGTF